MRISVAAAAFAISLFSAYVAGACAATASQGPITLRSGLDVTRATIPVEINGETFACVLDTGTSAMSVSRAVAMEAGLPSGPSVDEIAPDGLRYSDHLTRIDRFAVAGYTMRDTPALVSSKLTGNTVLCGYDFFAHIPTLIDRDRQLVTLFPSVAVLDQLRCLPIDLTPHVPLATVDINGISIDKVVLDSGMVGGGALWSGVLARLPQPPPDASGYGTYRSAYQNGLQCGHNAALGFVNGLSLVPVQLCVSSQRPDGYNGIVETNLPSVHQLAIDYPNRRICFSDGRPPAYATRQYPRR